VSSPVEVELLLGLAQDKENRQDKDIPKMILSNSSLGLIIG